LLPQATTINGAAKAAMTPAALPIVVLLFAMSLRPVRR
jgi:hypothetical protein